MGTLANAAAGRSGKGPGWGWLVALAVGVAACGGHGGDGEPAPPPPPPDLTGARVMLLPPRPGEPAGLEDELVFWLTDRAPATDWVLPDRIRDAVARTPAAGFDLAAPRTLKDMGGGQMRIRDPLYGDLRRIGALLDAELALVPLGTRRRADSTGVRLELTAALVDIRGGHVRWLHSVLGGPAGETDGVASAAAALARTLIPGSG